MFLIPVHYSSICIQKKVVRELTTYFMYHFLPIETYYIVCFACKTHESASLATLPVAAYLFFHLKLFKNGWLSHYFYRLAVSGLSYFHWKTLENPIRTLKNTDNGTCQTFLPFARRGLVIFTEKHSEIRLPLVLPGYEIALQTSTNVSCWRGGGGLWDSTVWLFQDQLFLLKNTWKIHLPHEFGQSGCLRTSCWYKKKLENLFIRCFSWLTDGISFQISRIFVTQDSWIVNFFLTSLALTSWSKGEMTKIWSERVRKVKLSFDNYEKTYISVIPIFFSRFLVHKKTRSIFFLERQDGCLISLILSCSNASLVQSCRFFLHQTVPSYSGTSMYI